MGDYALYKALQNYTPSTDSETLEFQKDDVFQIPVQSLFADSSTHRKGWLYAYNRRTGEEGYIPGMLFFNPLLFNPFVVLNITTVSWVTAKCDD